MARFQLQGFVQTLVARRPLLISCGFRGAGGGLQGFQVRRLLVQDTRGVFQRVVGAASIQQHLRQMQAQVDVIGIAADSGFKGGNDGRINGHKTSLQQKVTGDGL